MSRVVASSVALAVIVLLFAGRVSALVTQESVTPSSVKEKGSRFSITAERRDDGLIHVTIMYKLPRPQYLVAHFEVRDGDTMLLTTDTPSFVREETATYDVAESPKHLSNSKFELFANAFGESGGRAVALPGGAIFRIDLQAFAKDARVAKAN